MGEVLYKEDENFRKAMDRCESAYKSATDGNSLLDKMFKRGKSVKDEATSERNLAWTENT